MISADEQPPLEQGLRKVLLLVASSPSDLTETESTARALARRGHEVTLAYFYSGGSKQIHFSSLEKLTLLHGAELGLQTVAVDVDQNQQTKHAKIKDAATPSSASFASSAPHVSSGRVHAWIVKRNIGVAFNTQVVRLRTWMQRNGSLAVYHRFLNIVRAIRQRVSKFMMIRMPLPYAMIATLQLLRIYKSYEAMFGTLLEQRRYHAILAPEDVVGPFWPTLIKVGLKHKVPTVILPYTLANQEEAFKSLRVVPDCQTQYNRLAAHLFPKWRMKQDGYDVVRMPSGHVFVHQWLGTAPPDPWMMNSGNAKMICVDSLASRDYFLRAGIPEKKLRVTGSVSQDSLARVLQSKEAGLKTLYEELGLRADKPLLLISGCPNQLVGEVPHCEFSNMRDVAAHVGQVLSLTSEHYNLVVRPHPNYLEFGKFLRAQGVVTCLRPTAELVPLCDLFVAFASATIRWASACGIPTINYDIFNYGYGDFAASKGVVTVNNADQFQSVVPTLVPTHPRYAEIRSLSQADARYWSVMDGRGLQRIEEVISELHR